MREVAIDFNKKVIKIIAAVLLSTALGLTALTVYLKHVPTSYDPQHYSRTISGDRLTTSKTIKISYQRDDLNPFAETIEETNINL